MPRKTRQKPLKNGDFPVYCRKCRETKSSRNYFSAVDLILDTNGYFSVCKSCCEAIYQEMYRKSQNFSEAIYETCKILNLAFDERAITSANTRINEYMRKGSPVSSQFGIYKQALTGVKNVTDQTLTMTFSEPKAQKDDIEFDSENIPDDWILRWGTGQTIDDYIWLEKKLNQWKKTHKCDTEAEQTLLTELVWLQFRIKRERETSVNADTSAMVKDLQTLMKTAAVDPGKSAAANAGKSHDTFGEYIKVIEETEPAEFYEDKQLFADFDDLDKYFLDYVVRPLKNFIIGSRDFRVSVREDGELESVEIDEEDFESDSSSEG